MSCGEEISEDAINDPGIKLYSFLLDWSCSDRTKAVVESSCVENLGETQKSSTLGDRNESMTTTSCARPKNGRRPILQSKRK
ncbi:hypothetical protein FH972_002236 [Carpinus fangiana]|uniref:Uncharacterized protein n=1 Tax=Carpinus fangiana TaxID=176857 RepID=A0A5N6QHJ6_9ROSI|nr:hypothetical protein FH972_002236 [Carpinus fangiana]